MPDDAAELALCDQQPRANPALDLIARPPTFVASNPQLPDIARDSSN
jgi:hypothetical protein